MILALLLASSSPAGAQAPPEPGADPQAPATGPVAPAPAADEAEEAPKPSASSPPAMSDVEVITIRGRQHEDLLRDTSVSGTSFDTQDLDSLRIQNIADLAEYTPNLEIKSKSAASNPNLFIRGIGLKDYNANATSGVAIYQDGININAPAIQLFQLYDVESIEILRGPQGSGSGRNATAGAIRVNSVPPDGVFGGTASFTYGNYNTIEAEGAVSVPIIDELLSARLAFSASFADGNTDNECANWDPESIGKPRLTEQTIRDAWAAEIADGQRPPNQFFPIANSVDAQGRPLVPDQVCITRLPGRLQVGPRNAPLDPPIWRPDSEPTTRTLEDFQGLDERVNDVNNWAARGLLRFQPLPDMDWLLNGHGGMNRSGSRHLQMLGSRFLVTQRALAESISNWSEVTAAQNSGLEGVDVVGGFGGLASNETEVVPGGRRGDDPFSGWYDEDGDEYLDAYGVNLRGRWDLGRVVATSLTGYEWYDRLVEDEGDATPELRLPGDYSDTAWQVSQEFRVEGEAERFRWYAGGYYLMERLEALNDFPSTLNLKIEQSFDQDLWSLAPYVGGRYELTEELALDAGVRYNVEHKDFTLGSVAVGTSSGSQTPAIDEKQDDQTWTGVTGDLTLTYSPFWSVLDQIQNDRFHVYAKYGRGMKGGHYNAGLTRESGVTRAELTAADPEFNDAVEVGIKSGWLDDRLSLTLTGFRYWYTDLQVFDIKNAAGSLPTPELLNADARVWGAEVELEARPIPGLFVQSSFGWVDTHFESFLIEKAVSQGPRGEPINEVFDYAGNPLIAAPSYNVSTIVEYELDLLGWGSLVPQYDFSWKSKTYFDPQAIDPVSQPAYWLHNARLAYRTPDGRIEVAGWVQNLTDEQYKVDSFDLSIEFTEILEVWGDPRTYGFTITYSW